MGKIQTFLVNTALLCFCFFLIAGIFCTLNYCEITSARVKTAEYEREAARYKAEIEKLKYDTAKLKQESEQARLKAYIKAFNNGEYPLIQIER